MLVTRCPLEGILHDRPVFREPRVDVAGPIVAVVLGIPLIPIEHRASRKRPQRKCQAKNTSRTLNQLGEQSQSSPLAV